MQIQPLPSSGASKSDRRKFTGHQSERVVGEALAQLNYDVINLNDLGGNTPLVDLLVKVGSTRTLVQVKGTTVNKSAWLVKPNKAIAFQTWADALDCHAFFAFVWLNKNGGSTESDYAIRFATATRVAEVAKHNIDAYPKIARYSIDWSDLDPGISQGLPGGCPAALGWGVQT